MEIQASPRSVEVKCSDVLHCQLGKVTVSPSFCSGSPLPRPSLGALPDAMSLPGVPGRAPRPPGHSNSGRPRAPPRPLALSTFLLGLGDGPEGKGTRRVTRLTERSCDGDGGM